MFESLLQLGKLYFPTNQISLRAKEATCFDRLLLGRQNLVNRNRLGLALDIGGLQEFKGKMSLCLAIGIRADQNFIRLRQARQP